MIWKKKKFNLLIPFIAFIFISQSDASVLISDSQKGKKGGTVAFTISVRQALNEVNAFGFDFSYDASVLSFRRFEPGLLVSGYTNFSVNNIDFGMVRIGGFVAGQTAIVKGISGSLVRLFFEVVGQVSCSVQLLNLTDDIVTWRTQKGSFTNESSTENTGTSDISASDNNADKKESKYDADKSYQTGQKINSSETIIGTNRKMDNTDFVSQEFNRNHQQSDTPDSSAHQIPDEISTGGHKDVENTSKPKMENSATSHPKPVVRQVPETNPEKWASYNVNNNPKQNQLQLVSDGHNNAQELYMNKYIIWLGASLLIVLGMILVIQICILVLLFKIKKMPMN